MSKDTFAVLSAPQKILFLRAQAAPSRGGDTATLPSHPTTLSYSFAVNSQHLHAHHKEHEHEHEHDEHEHEQLGMTHRFTEHHNPCTSREHLCYQRLRLECPCSADADGTKPCRLHTRPFYHPLSLVIDKNNEVQSSEYTLYQRKFAHQ